MRAPAVEVIAPMAEDDPLSVDMRGGEDWRMGEGGEGSCLEDRQEGSVGRGWEGMGEEERRREEGRRTERMLLLNEYSQSRSKADAKSIVVRCIQGKFKVQVQVEMTRTGHPASKKSSQVHRPATRVLYACHTIHLLDASDAGGFTLTP